MVSRPTGNAGENDNGVVFNSVVLSERSNQDANLRTYETTRFFNTVGYDPNNAGFTYYTGRGFFGFDRHIAIIDMTLGSDGQPKFEVLYTANSDGNLEDGEGDDIIAAINQAAPPAAGPPPFDAWVIDTQLPTGMDGPNDDPDVDGIPNRLEFAMGLDPLNHQPALAPRVQMNGATMELVYQRNLAATDTTVSLHRGTSLDSPLGAFTPAAEDVSTTSLADNVEEVRVTVTSSAEREFFQFSATQTSTP